MAERSRVCTRDPNISRFELLAEKPGDEARAAFGRELTEFLKPRSNEKKGEFLMQLRECFDAQKKLTPGVNLPNFDFLPRLHVLV